MTLSGKKEIADYVKRSWHTVKEWIIDKKFPARKISGTWHSQKSLIDDWFEKQIVKKN